LENGLEEVKAKIISAWEKMTITRGTNPLIGRILGVLHTSGEPLSQKDISGKVGYELSAVSQALNMLVGLGAARRIKKPGERTGYYEPNTPVAVMLASTLRRWLEGEKSFQSDIKQQINRLKEIQDKTSKKEEARRLLKVLREMDLALQRFLEILEEAVTRMLQMRKR
jgi:DNA-binding transcriptional regulator GbsR (MarR family)